jgi:hypothetical protein
LPYLKKCVFCFDRVTKGEQPACVEACPEGASLFGKRRELIEIARQRIYQNPDKYHPYIYGEHEAGGTSMLFLSSVPVEKLDFRMNVGTVPYPEKTTGFLYAVPTSSPVADVPVRVELPDLSEKQQGERTWRGITPWSFPRRNPPRGPTPSRGFSASSSGS